MRKASGKVEDEMLAVQRETEDNTQHETCMAKAKDNELDVLDGDTSV